MKEKKKQKWLCVTQNPQQKEKEKFKMVLVDKQHLFLKNPNTIHYHRIISFPWYFFTNNTFLGPYSNAIA